MGRDTSALLYHNTVPMGKDRLSLGDVIVVYFPDSAFKCYVRLAVRAEPHCW